MILSHCHRLIAMTSKYPLMGCLDYLTACRVTYNRIPVSCDSGGQISPTQHFKIEFLPRRKQTIWFILYATRSAVYFKYHMKSTDCSCEKEKQLLTIKISGIYSNHYAVKMKLTKQKSVQVDIFVLLFLSVYMAVPKIL